MAQRTRLIANLVGWTLLVSAVGLLLAVWRQNGLSRIAALTILAAAVGGPALWTWVARRRAVSERVVVIGSGAIAAALIDEIESRRMGPYVVAGLVEEQTGVGRRLDGVTSLGTLDALEEIIDEVRPGVIVLALTERRCLVPDALLLDARMHGVAVEDVTTFLERLTGKIAIERLTPRSVVCSEGFQHPDFAAHASLSRALTRAANVVVAAIGLGVLAPLMGLIALLLKVDAPGPVLFRQDRTGRGGLPFRLIKFRTMRGKTAHGSEWVCDNADRITRVGRVLRRLRLDELPQLINVLRGEMNLIGPRPHPVSNYAWFLECIPYYRLRTAVRPGITGWAQVRYGYANSLEEETEKMRYDLYYIKHRSIWLDLRIVMETVVLLAGRSSSYAVANRRPTGPGWPDTWPGVPSPARWR